MASTLAYLTHVKGSDVTNEMLTKMRTDKSLHHCSPAWLANWHFQESDALWPDGRLVLVHLSYFPKLPKITFKKIKGSITRLLTLSSVLSISGLIRRASAPTSRWRLSWLKLLMVTTDDRWGRVQDSWSIIQQRCWYGNLSFRLHSGRFAYTI